MSAGPRTLVDVLADAQRLGTLGTMPIPDVISHAQQFLPALEGVTGTVLDLGTGAGIPGLVIAEAQPDLRLVLLDRREARTDALRRAVAALGWSDRVSVVSGDAERAGKDAAMREMFSAVVCRGFGPPAETLRVARAFLASGGRLVVSEPPQTDPDRWPAALMADLGFSKPQYLQGIVMFHVEQSPH